MIKVSFDPRYLKRVEDALGSLSRRAPREIATAINATAKKVRTEAARALRKELAVPVRILKKVIRTKSSANKNKLYAVVGLWKGHPIPLKYFGAKQVKGGKRGGGVTYRVSPQAGTRSVVRGAFILQPSGHAFRRQGQDRYPIRLVHGPAPGDAFVTAGVEALAIRVANTELPKQIERRIKAIQLGLTRSVTDKSSK